MQHTVVLVEDDVQAANTVESILKASHYEVVVIDSMKALREHFMEQRDCSIAIIDLHLPDSTDFDTIRRVRDVIPLSTPIVVLTGRDLGQFARVEGARMGVSYWLSKPARAEAMVEAVQTSIELADFFRDPHERLFSAITHVRDELAGIRSAVESPPKGKLAIWGEWFRATMDSRAMSKLLPIIMLLLGLLTGDCGRSVKSAALYAHGVATAAEDP